MRKKQDLINTLKQLAFRIKKEVDDSHSNGLIQPDEELYHRWKVDKFQYTEEGVTESPAHGEYITKKLWFRASIRIKELIKESDEYSSALKLLTKIVERKNKISRDLECFIRKLIFEYLDDSKFSDADVDIFVTNFLKDIREEPLKYGAKVELDGIVILPARIQFKIGDTNIILRQTRIEDLERELPIHGLLMSPYLPRPSAILDIEFPGRQGNEIQMKISEAITILRLFKAASIRYTSYRMRSESITDMMASGIVTGGRPGGVFQKGQITGEDVEKLKRFWQIMTRTLPVSFYEFGETRLDHTVIAYKRYCDALVRGGILERRIANAVMGLESLFLKGGETQELIYRLSIRIAKIFSLLKYDPYKVKEMVRDAYKVRSLFVHGDHLSYKEKRKLNDKYGDIRSFLLRLLDYLRISIIIAIFIKKEKEEFLDLIDDSLVGRDKDSQLNSLLNTARNVISGG